MQQFLKLYIFYTAIALFCQSCDTTTDKEATKQIEKLQTPNQIAPAIEFAKGFSLTYTDDYKLIDIYSPFRGSEDTLHYILLPEPHAIPTGFEKYQTIRIPVKNMVLTSTTHLAMVAHLDRLGIVSGLTDASFVYNNNVKEKLIKGEIKEIGKNGTLNIEAIVANKTKLVISGAWNSAAYDAYRPLIEIGIPVLVNAEWIEQHPLGRMEWLKLFGALLNEEKKAQELFEASKQQYFNLSEKTKDLKNKPTVINGMPYQGAWSIAGGNSYVGKLLKDAGADWHWEKDTLNVSYQMDFETVFPIGLEADYWIAPGRAFDLASIATIDNRFTDFKAYKQKKVFNYHGRVNEAGLYDFYESGVVQPETVLADLIKIFHPTILPEHDLYYFKKVE
ncbi:MAG: ABC transporter substrate-binding protein [Bacteroidota bacterium]